MHEYEIVITNLNGCAGAAYPQISFEEVQLSDPEDYLRQKYGAEFEKFVKEVRSDRQVVYSYHFGKACCIYEFTRLS